MAYPNQHNPRWQRVHHCEDTLALLASAKERVALIRKLAWHEANWQQVFIEASALLDELQAVHEAEKERWALLYTTATEGTPA